MSDTERPPPSAKAAAGRPRPDARRHGRASASTARPRAEGAAPPLPPLPPLPAGRPVVSLRAGAERRLRGGHPWVYSNEIEMTAAAKALVPGSLVALASAGGGGLGTAMFNPHPLISARLLSPDASASIDAHFLKARLASALALRERLIGVPYYRLVHAEADGLPGLIVDRFGDAIVIQPNTAGMEALLEPLIMALDQVCAPKAIMLRADSPARALEGLLDDSRVLRGPLPDRVEVIENGVRFFADLREGQKTGWFYDQRDNRALVARLSRGARVLDLYCHTGGFGVAALAAGASALFAVDRSAQALSLAEAATEALGAAARARFLKADVFTAAERIARDGERFDIVVADPPAFAKSRKDVPQALKAYRKLARLAAECAVPGGFLFIASCSHAIEPDAFRREVAIGLAQAGRTARILAITGAAPDHPQHPQLPESAYLKGLLLEVEGGGGGDAPSAGSWDPLLPDDAAGDDAGA